MIQVMISFARASQRRFAAKIVLTLLIFTFVQGTSLAWGPGGHMMIAYIAYENLNPNARSHVDAILSQSFSPIPNPVSDLNNPPQGISQNEALFIDASHWADDVRPTAAFSSTADNHFIDQPFSNDGTPLPSDLPKPNNVVVALNNYTQDLQQGTNQQEALRFIIHFVGDVHQPLHCATLVSAANPEGDQGGNLLMIKAKLSGHVKTIKLHSYWDEGLSTFPPSGRNFAPPQLSLIVPAAASIMHDFPVTDSTWQNGGPFGFQDWADESFSFAKSTAYNLQPNELVTDNYQNAGVTVARNRIAWAGYRLAALLNAIWPPASGS